MFDHSAFHLKASKKALLYHGTLAGMKGRGFWPVSAGWICMISTYIYIIQAAKRKSESWECFRNRNSSLCAKIGLENWHCSSLDLIRVEARILKGYERYAVVIWMQTSPGVKVWVPLSTIFFPTKSIVAILDHPWTSLATACNSYPETFAASVVPFDPGRAPGALCGPRVALRWGRLWTGSTSLIAC